MEVGDVEGIGCIEFINKSSRCITVNVMEGMY